MEKIKKYLDLILVGVIAFFSVLIFALMAAPGVSVTLLGSKASSSVYDCLSDSWCAVLALIFNILILLLSIGLIVLKLMKKELGFENILHCVLAGLAFVGGIMFFLTKAGLGDGASGFNLGGGAIICGIFAIIEALLAIGLFLLPKFKKENKAE